MSAVKDVAVLGAGPAGCATAIALARRGYSVVLIERSAYQSDRVGETLPSAVRRPLASLGVWDLFLAGNHTASFGIHSAWGRPDLYVNDSIFNPYGHGWNVNRAQFDLMLATAAGRAGATVHTGVSLARFDRPFDSLWQIEIRNGEQTYSFKARVMVDASGRAAVLARRHGARRISYDRLVGVTAFYRPQQSRPAPGCCTLVESVENGWWYSSPLPDGRMVAAYMTDADLCPRGARISAEYLQKQIMHGVHTALRLDGYAPESRPFFSAANSAWMDSIAGRNWLAVGDAAAAFDPLSSQGVLVALKSGLHAARAIEDYLSGKSASLQDYATWVKKGFEEYLIVRDLFYNRERRWPASAFWRRRQTEPLVFGEAAEPR